MINMRNTQAVNTMGKTVFYRDVYLLKLNITRMNIQSGTENKLELRHHTIRRNQNFTFQMLNENINNTERN